MAYQPWSEKYSLVFDLDDTLFDTKIAVQTAYRAAGVDMPDAMYGRPWQEWLPTLLDGTLDEVKVVHDMKNHLYIDMIENGAVERTEAFAVFASDYESQVLTGASRPPARALLGKYRTRLALTSASWKDKALYLAVSTLSNAIYIDDNEMLGRRVVQSANATRGNNSFKFIHYIGQSADRLREQIRACQ